MKNKTLKIALLVLSFTLLVGAAFAMSVSADDTVKPQIISQNVAYEGDFALMYAVDAEGITGSVTLNVYDVYPSETSVAPVFTQTVAEAEDVEGNLNKRAYVFTTAGVAAADMCKQFYIQAVVDETDAKSEILRYSVAEYLYERLATTGSNAPSADQALLYETVIAFGDQAQKVVGKIADPNNRIKNYRFVTTGEGVKLDTYFTTGVYPIGTTLSLTADGSGVGTKWTVTPYTNGTAGTPLTNQASVIVSDATRLHVEYGASSTITYTDGYRDLEDLAQYYDAGTLKNGSSTYKTDGFGSKGIGGVDFGFTKLEDSHGMVMFSDLLNGNNYNTYLQIKNGATGKTYTAVANATAWEVSFDIKMQTSGDASDRMMIDVRNGSNFIFSPINLHQYDSAGNPQTDLVVQNSNKADQKKTFAGVNPFDWFHISIVFYQNETDAAYVYINGNTAEGEYLKLTHTKGDIFSQLDNIYVRGNGEADTVYIDNIFMGYTTATNPHTN